MDHNRMVSDLLGEFTVHSRSESESDNGGSRGRSEQARKLQKADEVRGLEFEMLYAIMDGVSGKLRKPWQKVKRNGRDEIRFL